jgi:hypothetical protein
MTSLPYVPNVLKCSMTYAIGDDNDAMNIMHFLYSGTAPASSDCAALAGVVRAAFNTDLKAYVHAGTTLNQVTMLDLASSTGKSGIDTTAVTGTEGGAGLTASVAALINFGIAQRYRGGKPRIYFPGFTTSDTATLGHWSPTSVSNLSAAFATFIAAIIGANSGGTTITEHVAVSYYHGYNPPTVAANNRAKNHPALRAGGPVTYQITSWSVNPKPGNQRRRYVRN